MTKPTVLIEITADLLGFFGARTEDGQKLTYELGEPTGSALVNFGSYVDDRPVYTPTVTMTDDGMVLVKRPSETSE